MTQPKPHPEVVNEQPRVLIVGYGHVGRQMARYFTEADYVDEDGVIRRVADGEPVEGCPGYALGFICVPTPPCADGHCDTSIVQRAFDTWRSIAMYWCVKSTVPPGTCDRLGPNVCFSPEYYGETLGHPLTGVNREIFVILGGPPHVTQAFAFAWTLVTHANTRIYQTTAKTAELVKLMENSWLATKVAFCNQFYDLAWAAGVDWNQLRELWLADPRITRSHTYVYPANRGFAGKCLPKDTASLCQWARDLGEPAVLMEMVRAYNDHLREEM